MASKDDDEPWTRQLLVGLGALAAISLMIGAVISIVVVGAAKLSGIGSSQAHPTTSASLYMPPLSTITNEPAPAAPNVSESPSASATSSPTGAATSKSPKPPKKSKSISLQAIPHDVHSGNRITFSGVYSVEGTILQVQRLEAGNWVDFPTTATVRGGIFETYIYSGKVGANRFRVYDSATSKASNAVRVNINP